MDIHFFDEDIEQFILGLQKSTRAKVLRTIDRLEKFGPDLGMPHSKSIGRRLFELRIHGDQEVRLVYTFYNQGAVILYGFLKKSQQLSARDFHIALRRKAMLDNI